MLKIAKIIALVALLLPAQSFAYTLGDITSGAILHTATSTGSSGYSFNLDTGSIAACDAPAGVGQKRSIQTIKSQLFNFSITGQVQAIWFRGAIGSHESSGVSNMGVDLVIGGGQNLGGTEAVVASGTLEYTSDISSPFVLFNQPYLVSDIDAQYRLKISIKGDTAQTHTFGLDNTTASNEIYYCKDQFNIHDVVLMFNAYGFPLTFTPPVGISTSTPTFGFDCSLLTGDGLTGAFAQNSCIIFGQLGQALFIPSASSTDELTGLWELIKNKPPIGYFYVVQSALLALSTSSPAVAIPDLSAIDLIMQPMYDGITLLLWLLFTLWLFYRIKHFIL